MNKLTCFSLPVILFAWLVFAGCEESRLGGDRVCTEIGCSDGISVQVSDQRPDSISISIFRNQDIEPIASRQCTEPDQSCVLFAAGETPENVSVEIGWEGGAFRETFSPQYEEFRPNGPGCPPTCRMASIDIDLSALKR